MPRIQSYDDANQCCKVLRTSLYATLCRCRFLEVVTVCYLCHPVGTWAYEPVSVKGSSKMDLLLHLFVSVFRAWAHHCRKAKEVGRHLIRGGDEERLLFLNLRSGWEKGWEWARIAMNVRMNTACDLVVLFRGLTDVEKNRRLNHWVGVVDDDAPRRELYKISWILYNRRMSLMNNWFRWQ